MYTHIYILFQILFHYSLLQDIECSSLYYTVGPCCLSIYFIYSSLMIPFILSSCLIALRKSSNTMMNRNGESGHPCLVPDLRGKAFNLSPLNIILAWTCHVWSLL